MKLKELKKIGDQHIKELEEKLANSVTKINKNEKNNYGINNNDNVINIHIMC